MIDIDFSKYKNAHDLLKETGLSPQECIKIIDAEVYRAVKETLGAGAGGRTHKE